MAHCIYTGQALAVPQITTITISGTVAAGNTVWLEINRKRATATAQSGDTTAVLAGRLYDAINALVTGGNAPEFAEIVFVDPRIAVAASFTATSNTAGQPFTVSTGATGGGATIGTTATQASTGPNHLDNAANWSGNAVPVDGDDITFPAGCPDYLYGLTALTTIAAVTVRFLGGSGGLPDRTGTTPNDPNNYVQYRGKYVELESATSIVIGDGTNAPEFLRLKITGAVVTPIRVMAGEGTATGQAIQLSAAAGTAHTVTILGNSVALAPADGEVLEIGTLRIGTDGPEASFGATDTDPTVVIGSGVTITTGRFYGGTVTSDGTFTALTIIDGTWSQDRGSPGTVSATDSAGTYRYAGNASHGAITARGAGVTIDLTPDSRGFTLANSSVTEGAAIYNPQRANCTALTIDKESIAVSELGNSLTVALTAA
jgi:hypothetical protein